MEKEKKKMGRPLKYGEVSRPICIRMPLSLIAEVTLAARRAGRTRNEEFIQRLLGPSGATHGS